jgi:hypothetical protein
LWVIGPIARHLDAARLGVAERTGNVSPLAFVSPCIIAAIVDGTAPADLGHRPRQSAAVFVGRAGAEHRAPTIKVFHSRTLHADVARERYAAPQTGLRPISNRSQARRNGNWKLASRDWRRKATSPDPKFPEFADQRLGRASLTCGNVGCSHAPGNRIVETANLGMADPKPPSLVVITLALNICRGNCRGSCFGIS